MVNYISYLDYYSVCAVQFVITLVGKDYRSLLQILNLAINWRLIRGSIIMKKKAMAQLPAVGTIKGDPAGIEKL